MRNLERIGLGLIATFVGAYLVYVLAVVAINVMSDPHYVAYTTSSVVVQADIKPSYDYLKSVTVVIYGRGTETIASREEKFQQEKDEADAGHVKWMGTGVVIKVTSKYTYILTNAHVTGNKMADVTLYVKDEIFKEEAQIIKVHKNVDIAVIRVGGHLIGKRAIKGITRGRPQDKVYLVGNYLAHIYTYGEGVFAGYNDDMDIIQLPCLFGDSGSGVFNQDGKMVALIEGVEGQIIGGIFPLIDIAHALAVDSASIELFLDTIHYK